MLDSRRHAGSGGVHLIAVEPSTAAVQITARSTNLSHAAR